MIERVIGNYRIVEKIGEGGMGAVYRAVDLMLEREVAIKAIRPELSREPEIVERFRAEAKMLARVHHPAIATIFSFFLDDGELFLAMEFVRGQSLSRLLQATGPLPWERAVPLLAVALEGIEQAHRAGIVHRDLKPDNLMITESGAIKVMDFGIGRLMGSGRLTRTGLLIGTLRYMAPEQIRGEEVDRRTDVYALGTVLYEMLTGRVPFDGSSDYAVLKAQVEVQPAPPSVAMPGLPDWLDQAILRSLAKDPDQRFATVEELRLFLLGQGLPVTADSLPIVVSIGAQPTLLKTPAPGTYPAGDRAAPQPGSLPQPGGLPQPGALPRAGDTPPPAPLPGSTLASGTTLRPPPPRTPAPEPAPVLPPTVPRTPSPLRPPAPNLDPGAGSHPDAVAPPRSAAAGRPWRPALVAALAGAALVAVALLYRLREPAPAAPPAAATIAAPATAAPRTPTTQTTPTAGPAPAAVARSGLVRAPGDGAPATSPPAAPAATSAGTATAALPAASSQGLAASPAPTGGATAAAAGGETAAPAPGAPAAGERPRGRRARRGASTEPARESGATAAGGAGAADPATPPARRETADGRAGGGEDEAGGSSAPAPAASGGAAGGLPAAELGALGAEMEVESDELRNLYSDFLAQKEKSGSRLTRADDRLKDELKEFQNAAERFGGQFKTGFFARARKRLGRMGHGEDERGQITRLARALTESGSRVEALVAQTQPDPAVRQLWRRIHRQSQRVAELCGI
jgi:eukaryotic-like serine/threonine-protein kinase